MIFADRRFAGTFTDTSTEPSARHSRDQDVVAARSRRGGLQLHRIVNRVCLYTVVSILVVAILFPVYWMVVVSVTPLGFSRSPSISLVPSSVTFDHYRALVSDGRVLRWVFNSAVVAFISVGIAVSAGASAGYALSRYKFPGSTTIPIIMLATTMIPQVSVVVPLFSLAASLGLLNTRSAVVIAHVTIVLPLVTWLSKGFFDKIPTDLHEAAILDGCGPFQAFYRIALPLAVPGLLAISVFAFIASWNDLIMARTLATTPSLWTAPVGLASFRGEYWTGFEAMMAAAFVFSIPAVVVFLGVQRYFIQGLMAGSVKG